MGMVICTREDFDAVIKEHLDTGEIVKVHVLQSSVLRLIRNKTETFDGVRNVTNISDLGNIEMPEMGPGQAHFLKVTMSIQGQSVSSTKYIATVEGGIWLCFRDENTVYLTPEVGDGIPSLVATAKKKTASLVVIRTKSFAIYAN